MDFATIIGIISGFVTLEEAALPRLKKYLENKSKTKIDDINNIKSNDDFINYYIDKFKTSIFNGSKYITEECAKKIKEEYYSRNKICIIDKKEIDKKIDDIIQVLNNYIEQHTSIGEKAIIKKQNEQNKTLDKIEENINKVVDYVNKDDIANSTLEFKEKYNKELFWDDEYSELPIKLSDVYVNPRTISDKDIISEIKEFLHDNKRNLLIVEAVAGSGKTSLMSKLANIYCDSKHYFLKFSELDMGKNIDLIDSILQYSKMDKVWEKFYQKDNVIFFDGLDEVFGKIEFNTFEKDMRKLFNKDIKVVITTRPNYLNDSNYNEYKIKMVPFNKCQIREWIDKYAQKKNLTSEDYYPYLSILENDEKYKALKDIITIPIFLYIIVNRCIDMDKIETQTQLFNNVIKQLNVDKVNQDQYDLHNEIAECMGFYLQSQMMRVLKIDKTSEFLSFCNSVLKEAITEGRLFQAFESIFIKSISEGENVKEFYHKSIQDYFSASYIYNALKKIVNKFDDGDKEDLGILYASLLDKHNIKEEMPHLQFFINDDKSMNKKKWVKGLQGAFQMIIDEGINPDTEQWFHNRFSKHDGKISVYSISARYRYICDNHIMIMEDIFQEKLCDTTSTFNQFIKFVANDIMSVGNMYREEFIWKAFYKQDITAKDLYAVNNVDDYRLMLETMMNRGGIANNIKLYVGDIELKNAKKLNKGFKSSELSNFLIESSTFHEIVLVDTIVREFKIMYGIIEYINISFSKIIDSTIFSHIKGNNITNSDFVNCTIGSEKQKRAMKVACLKLKDVSFTNVKFLYVECGERTIFENVVFRQCIFNSNLGKKLIFKDCKMDILSYNSFKNHNSDLVSEFEINIIS